MNPLLVLERIRRLSERQEGLFRIHRTHAGLYARARRQFGSWQAAVLAAGCDYVLEVERARRRALENRRAGRPSRRRSPPNVNGPETSRARSGNP